MSTDKKEPWQPKNHYSLSLKDIQEQFTPSEAYRHRLATEGKLERTLRRLEVRWTKSIIYWTRSSIKVQAFYRGCRGRILFKVLKPNLVKQREQRDAKKAILEASRNGEKRQEALDILERIGEKDCDLFIFESKISYSLQQFERSEEAARHALALEPDNTDAKYLICCALINKQFMNQAFDQLSEMINTDCWPTTQRVQVYFLRAYAATRMIPPQFQQAVLDFTFLIGESPLDLNLYLQRACAYSGLQDWTHALADLCHVLVFQPKLAHVLAIRARVYCCIRDWKKAREDYKSILDRNPSDAVAQRGLAECSEPSPEDEFPMLDSSLVE